MARKFEYTKSHSRGPWKFWTVLHPSFGERFDVGRVDGDSDCPIATVHNDPTALADARLIASAPKLLEACKALQSEAAARGCGLRIADEAIAEAEGAQ